MRAEYPKTVFRELGRLGWIDNVEAWLDFQEARNDTSHEYGLKYALASYKLLSHLRGRQDFKVFFFGSRAKKNYLPYSDLDLWIEAIPPLLSQDVSRLRENFENSNLAIQVDIVTLEICLPEYKNNILNERQLWLSL